MKKLLYLFLALLLPGLIFVFLKYQGANRFDIPVYYEEGVERLSGMCPKPVPGPYVVPDSVWSRLERGKQKANVILFNSPQLEVSTVSQAVGEEIGNDVSFTSSDQLSPDSLIQLRWWTCAFMMTSPRQTVLLDNLGRIRGYYDLRSREEVDRLRVELKILLEQY